MRGREAVVVVYLNEYLFKVEINLTFAHKFALA